MKKINEKLSIYYIVGAMLLVAASYFVGFYRGKQPIDTRLAENETRLATSEYKLSLCQENRAELISTSKTTFPIKDLGVSSQFLNGKEVEVYEWEYRGEKITQYVIRLPSEGTSPIVVAMWNYLGGPPYTMVTFDQNGRNPLPVHNSFDRQEIKNYAPKNRTGKNWQQESNSLSALARLTTAHQVYIKIVDVNGYGPGGEIEGNGQSTYTKELEPIADSIIY